MEKMEDSPATRTFIRMLSDTGHTDTQMKYITGWEDHEIKYAIKQTQASKKSNVVTELENGTE